MVTLILRASIDLVYGSFVKNLPPLRASTFDSDMNTDLDMVLDKWAIAINFPPSGLRYFSFDGKGWQMRIDWHQFYLFMFLIATIPTIQVSRAPCSSPCTHMRSTSYRYSTSRFVFVGRYIHLSMFAQGWWHCYRLSWAVACILSMFTVQLWILDIHTRKPWMELF